MDVNYLTLSSGEKKEMQAEGKTIHPGSRKGSNPELLSDLPICSLVPLTPNDQQEYIHTYFHKRKLLLG